MRTCKKIAKQAFDKYVSSYQTVVGINAITDKDKVTFRGKGAIRLISVLNFRKYVKRHDLKSNKMLGISAQDDFEINELPISHFDNFLYEDDPDNYDVQDLNLPDKDYDFAMMNQTFEHLVDPLAAVKSIHKHLLTNGYFYANWPVINIRHAEPLHFFTGLTVTYINYLLMSVGFEVIECGAWGNKHYVDYIFEHNSWPKYGSLPSLENNPKCPCIGWVLGKKI